MAILSYLSILFTSYPWLCCRQLISLPLLVGTSAQFPLDVSAARAPCRPRFGSLEKPVDSVANRERPSVRAFPGTVGGGGRLASSSGAHRCTVAITLGLTSIMEVLDGMDVQYYIAQVAHNPQLTRGRCFYSQDSARTEV